MKKILTTTTLILLLSACNNTTSPNNIKNSSTSQNGIVIDGLTYENKPLTKEYIWKDANKYCQEKGWRLPTAIELSKISNIPLYNSKDIQSYNHKEYKEWFAKNKSKRNANLFVKKEFVKNMSKGGSSYWTSDIDQNHTEDGNTYHIVLFYDGYIGTNEPHIGNRVLCVK